MLNRHVCAEHFVCYSYSLPVTILPSQLSSPTAVATSPQTSTSPLSSRTEVAQSAAASVEKNERLSKSRHTNVVALAVGAVSGRSRYLFVPHTYTRARARTHAHTQTHSQNEKIRHVKRGRGWWPYYAKVEREVSQRPHLVTELSPSKQPRRRRAASLEPHI